MATEAEIEAQIAELDALIASGEKRTKFKDRETENTSLREQIAARAVLVARLNGIRNARPRARQTRMATRSGW